MFCCHFTDPPVITSHFPTNLTVLPGERVNLKCEAIGNPVPVVYWEHLQADDGNDLLCIFFARKYFVRLEFLLIV